MTHEILKTMLVQMTAIACKQIMSCNAHGLRCAAPGRNVCCELRRMLEAAATLHHC
jgi:hypothetical protein